MVYARNISRIIILHVFFLFPFLSLAQLSPGDLSEAHAHLEGLSNCTQCHVLNQKVANDRCLACHDLLNTRITQGKGFHASKEVAGKDCVKCHSDHHGRKFQMIRFDTVKFNHKLTGYELQGEHSKPSCAQCHTTAFISNPEVKRLKRTYLGLKTDCLNCHEGFHEETVSVNCMDCHSYESFKSVPNFNHEKSSYPLVGKHQGVSCEKCHPSIQKDGSDYLVLKGLKYANCADCHDDVHKNKFGQNCVRCHSEVSFHTIKGLNTFNHSKTDYPLEGKHIYVDCKLCHKTNYTNPINTSRCANCHTDYHNGQFTQQKIYPDCSECHTVNSFVGSSYTIEKHDNNAFPLKGAHLATPCFNCHKKDTRWEFKEIGLRCADCHSDIHESFLDKKYYPEKNCKNCHDESHWSFINFNHSNTRFELEGKHQHQSCRACHFKKDEKGVVHQQFVDLANSCTNCHSDVHYNQFEKDGITDCLKCHDFSNWKANKFDHGQTDFKLDGAHKKLACKECHKQESSQNTDYILYIIKKFRCEDCHK